jgi:hypothetical protein
MLNRALLVMACLIIAMVVACAEPVVVESADAVPSPAGQMFFQGGASPWRQPVPANAPIDPDSDRYIGKMSDFHPAVALRKFNVSVFMADPTTPRHRVVSSAAWAADGLFAGVPIPETAQMSPDLEHLVVLEPAERCVYEFYRPRRTGEEWAAEWVNATPSDGDGIYPDGLSARGTGISLAAGLVWPDELAEGEINHALVFAYPLARRGGPVGLATRSNGESTDDGALPIGARLVLDPAIDVRQLDLSPAERTIAVALQRYGMILASSGGGITLSAVDPNSFSDDPYGRFFGEAAIADLSKIPFNRMKVLALGETKPRWSGPRVKIHCIRSRPSG